MLRKTSALLYCGCQLTMAIRPCLQSGQRERERRKKLRSCTADKFHEFEAESYTHSVRTAGTYTRIFVWQAATVRNAGFNVTFRVVVNWFRINAFADRRAGKSKSSSSRDFWRGRRKPVAAECTEYAATLRNECAVFRRRICERYTRVIRYPLLCVPPWSGVGA